jgi:hypothetical protein
MSNLDPIIDGRNSIFVVSPSESPFWRH